MKTARKSPVKYKYEVFLNDKWNITHRVQPGRGYQSVTKCVKVGLEDLSKLIKEKDVQGRLIVKDVARNAIVLNTGLFELVDHSKY